MSDESFRDASLSELQKEALWQDEKAAAKPQTAEEAGINDEFFSDPVEQIGRLILDFQRRLDGIEDNLARLFKEIGHEHTWSKITGE